MIVLPALLLNYFGQGANLLRNPELAHHPFYSFFIGHERLQTSGTSRMWRWQAALFRFLSRNALDVAAFYDIPIEQVIEAGVGLRL